MDDICKITLLLDLYGNLLTNRQLEAMQLHYNEDMSYGEISELLKISRQAAYDLIKKGITGLEKYEAKLGLLERFFKYEITYKEKTKRIKKAIIDNNIKEALLLLDEIEDVLLENK